MVYSEHAQALARHLAIAPFRDRLAAIAPDAIDPMLEESILDEAARFAEGVIEAGAAALDREGVRMEDGRARLGQTFQSVWRAYRDMGWLTMGAPAPKGQGLSLALVCAVDEMFNRASPGFCMLPNASRTAAVVIAAAAPDAIGEEWVARLLSGERAATICISEPDAGSDVGRIRTRASPGDDGWRVTGEKCWISFGDHDGVECIGHLALARSNDAKGVRGLSLFLIPSHDDSGVANGVHLRRIEEKLGLHCSPTCQIGFENARAILLGQEGRGLQTLFPMMLLMRLSCGPMGTGVAAGAFATALGYARDRKQGGPADRPPVAIVEHADVQRLLLEMASAVELNRGLSLATANALELAERCSDREEATRWRDLAQFLLPLVKDGAAWAAVDSASKSIQVLGGAGFTREWAVERHYRDARVFPIFEGTTGIQGVDLVHRRLWRDGGAGLRGFLAAMAVERQACVSLNTAASVLEETGAALGSLADTPREGEAGATAFLDLCSAVAQGWIAARILGEAGEDQVGARMAAAASFYLADLPARGAYLAAMARAGSDRLSGISAWLER